MEKLAALVPELYYDLIGRLVPGTISAAFLAVAFFATLREGPPISGSVVIFLAVVTAYAAGLLLDAAAGLTIGPANTLVRRVMAFLPVFRNRSARTLDSLNPWAFMRGGAQPDASAVVGKLLAERTCLRSLTLLWALVWLKGAQPSGALGTLWCLAIFVGLALGQYRWDYLARATVSTYQKVASERVPKC